MPKRDKPFQVEALTSSDTFDCLVARHFRGRPIHFAEDTGPFNVAKIIEKFGGRLLRSRQEYLQAPNGNSTKLEWASLCFQFEEDVFVTMMAKGNSQIRGRTGEEEYKLTVTADTPQRATLVLADLRREFHHDGWPARSTGAAGSQTLVGFAAACIALW